MELVRAWDDGWRMFHVFTGTKYVTLLDYGTLRSKRILPKDYRLMCPKPVIGIPVSRTIRMLKEHTEHYKELDVWHSRGLCQQFLKRWQDQL